MFFEHLLCAWPSPHQIVWIQILTPPLPRCAALGKFLNLSVPDSPSIKQSLSHELLTGLNELIHMESSGLC